MIERNLFCGIDPGRTGGIALIESRSCVTLSLGSSTETEIAAFLRSYASSITFATIERVWMRSGDSPNVGKLIESYGFLRGVLAAFNIPRTEVIPQKWQAKLGVPGDDKPALRQYIQQRYPAIRWTNGTAAAGCLAEYTRLVHTRIGRPASDDSERDHRGPGASSIFASDGDGEEISATTKALRAFE